MKKPTLHDVARTAGVSYATADRVLNQRGGVAEKSILRVQQAISDLGYTRDIHAANLSRQRTYRFRFYLPAGDHSFFAELRDALDRQIPPRLAERMSITLHQVPALDPDALADELSRIGADDCDCVAIVAPEGPRLVAALGRLADLGVPAVTLVADAGADLRAAYIGIDNLTAGATAGRLVALAHTGRTGRILPVMGAQISRDHRDRWQGAQAVLAGAAVPLTLLPPIEVLDRPDRMRDLLAAKLQDDPGISGIYSIGAGNRALIALMQQMGAARPFVVLHELTAPTRDALEQGLIDAVIDQKPEQEIDMALTAMKAIADGLPPQVPGITPTIYLKENLPERALEGDIS